MKLQGIIQEDPIRIFIETGYDTALCISASLEKCVYHVFEEILVRKSCTSLSKTFLPTL